MVLPEIPAFPARPLPERLSGDGCPCWLQHPRTTDCTDFTDPRESVSSVESVVPRARSTRAPPIPHLSGGPRGEARRRATLGRGALLRREAARGPAPLDAAGGLPGLRRAE